MKYCKFTNIVAIVAAIIILCSCTKQMVTRNFGGSSEIKLEKGQRLVEMTWKNDDLWILTEPMDSDYVPKTKVFYESSSFGILEGKIVVIEAK